MTHALPAFYKSPRVAGGGTNSSHGVLAMADLDEEAQPGSGMTRALKETHPTSPLTGGEILVGGSHRDLTAAMEMDMTTQRK